MAKDFEHEALFRAPLTQGRTRIFPKTKTFLHRTTKLRAFSFQFRKHSVFRVRNLTKASGGNEPR